MADPNTLIEMTIKVTSFSSDALNSSLIEIPAGYTRMQPNPKQSIGNGPQQSPAPAFLTGPSDNKKGR